MKIKTLAGLFACVFLLLASCAQRPVPAPDTEPGIYAPDIQSVPMQEDSVTQDAASPVLEEPVSSIDGPPVGEPVPDEVSEAENGLSAMSTASFSDIDLSIPAEFKITRPGDKFTTTRSAYFITGTSDPSLPVYYEDEEIERQGTKGVFGVLAELEIGTNAFTFSQGDETCTITIIRKEEPKTTPIDKILQDSMFPRVQGGVKAGGSIPVRCVAPAGSRVSATFDGVTVELEQIAEIDTGIPVVFTGGLPVGSVYDENKTVKKGSVTYTLSLDGAETKYESAGTIYVAGKNSTIAVEVTGYAGFVYHDTLKLHEFKEKLKEYATDYVVWQNNDYFELASGGYISVEMAQIIEGEVEIDNGISGTVTETGAKDEEYTFYSSTFPAYYSRVDNGVFYLTIYNTAFVAEADTSFEPDIGGSRLFSTVKAVEKDNSVTYEFAIRDPDRLWGYDVSWSDDAIKLRFKYRPILSAPANPLNGVVILIDPGHGGTDGGALGVPGATGPTEAAINLATSLAVKDRLESLGAEVHLTREDDSYLHLNSRMLMIESYDADMFLSIHHNSVREDADANEISGMEVYYHDDLSEIFAEDVMAGLAAGLEREKRFVKQSYYRVTLMPYCPAVLLELGYMSNPLEYEMLTDENQILKVAEAIAGGVKTL